MALVQCAEIYGPLLNDRLLLWMCRRRGGNWKPEYCLYLSLIPQAVILPIAFGIIGVSLQYHPHCMVLALGVFLVNFCGISLLPIVSNYMAESSTNHASEANTIMSFYRLILGLFVPFFIDGWEARVGAGCVFGMMAFFARVCVFLYCDIGVQRCHGSAILFRVSEAVRRGCQYDQSSSGEGTLMERI